MNVIETEAESLLSSTTLVVIGVIAIVIFAIIGVLYIDNLHLQTKLKTAQLDMESERDAAATQALNKDKEYRAKEQATAASQAKAVSDAQTQKDAALAASNASADALKRLQLRAKASAVHPQPACNSPAPASGPATSQPDVVPAELLDRVGQAAVDLAAIADQYRIAGQACASAYNALR